MNGPTSLNQSITAAWSTAAPKKRTKRAIPLNSSTSSRSSPGPPDTQPTASTSALPTPLTEDRPPTPTARVARKRPRHDPEQLAAKYAPPELKLSSLGGLESQITQLMEVVVLPLLHPEIYLHTGVPRPRGVLLHGVPGGGKTQLVKCLAGVGPWHRLCPQDELTKQELGLPFISVSAPSIVSGMSGESEKTLRDTFDEAKVSSLGL